VKRPFTRPGGILLALFGAVISATGWDYEGHRVVNQLALASLPTNFPAFALTAEARERVAFLSGEPDRWRNTPDQPLRHFNGPDHFFDLDELPLFDLTLATVSPFRYEFAMQIANARSRHAERFAPIDPLNDSDQTRALIGFLPWAITEYQGKLKSAFSYLREFEQAGTAEEIANAQQNIIALMGVMGHFVGDGAQPLHTTKHYNGWVGRNPDQFTTNRTFHSWIDGGYLQKYGLDAGKLREKLRSARLITLDGAAVPPTNVFPVVMNYLQAQAARVKPLYRLDKEGKLSGQLEVSSEGYDFITGQILVGAQMLGDLWFTAWQQAPPDTYLRSALARRKLANEQPASEQPREAPIVKPGD